MARKAGPMFGYTMAEDWYGRLGNCTLLRKDGIVEEWMVVPGQKIWLHQSNYQRSICIFGLSFHICDGGKIRKTYGVGFLHVAAGRFLSSY